MTGESVALEMVNSHGMSLVVGEISRVWVFVVYNVAVDSSKDGGECWEVVGNDTSNSILSLISTSKEKVGKMMVQVLFSLYSKYPTYFVYCLMLKRDTSMEGT